MSFFGIWSMTFIVSVVCEFKNELKIFKDFADIGYKINIDRLDELSKMISSYSNNSSLINYLIPFYNIFYVLKKVKLYEENKQHIFEQYMTLGLIDEMSDIEKEEYQKKPTAFNAILVPIKCQANNDAKRYINGSITIESKDSEVSVVNIKIDLEARTLEDMIKIVSSKGPISNLPIKQQYEMIYDNFSLVANEGKAKFGDIDSFVEEIMNTQNITLESNDSEVKESDDLKPLSRLERYKQLRQSIIENGFLYGEEMFEYQELKEEFGNDEALTLKKNIK